MRKIVVHERTRVIPSSFLFDVALFVFFFFHLLFMRQLGESGSPLIVLLCLP